ncbi:ATP-binding protein [Plantactinospora soyae]|uniref:Anti-sigma regulatory factor (Ser/Thr protein kinase) n=1 Tax=Plantactinospora soyae TaxID=1544732 RepID=A0A927LYT8_9ACTN|nr:ATP-binding protein [Plantactinospora soyae]MBE1484414.1 anti-sigma regulatory factor (Ser/Thr protein kinase) [Plantactinospora soyae]
MLFQDDFDGVRVADVRRTLTECLHAAGLGGPRLDDFVTAINEAMTNAVRHGGGWGEVRLWRAEHLVCEVRDRGPGLADPLTVPRARPRPSANGGMGLWLARELADSIDVRSDAEGVRVRLTMTPEPSTDADPS